MDLRESRFYYAGQDMNFAVFSDYPCRVRAAHSQWIVVQQRNDGKSRLKFFVRVREGETFRENESHELPKHLKEQILQRLPKASEDGERPRAA